MVMGLTLWGTSSEVVNMMPTEHDRIGNTIDGSNCMVLIILIIFVLLPKYFHLVITYIKLLHRSLVRLLREVKKPSPLHTLHTHAHHMMSAYRQCIFPTQPMNVAPLESPESLGLTSTRQMHENVYHVWAH